MHSFYRVDHHWDSNGEPTTYFVQSPRYPSNEELISALGIDFNADAGESLEITEIFPTYIE